MGRHSAAKKIKNHRMLHENAMGRPNRTLTSHTRGPNPLGTNVLSDINGANRIASIRSSTSDDASRKCDRYMASPFPDDRLEPELPSSSVFIPLYSKSSDDNLDDKSLILDDLTSSQTFVCEDYSLGFRDSNTHRNRSGVPSIQSRARYSDCGDEVCAIHHSSIPLIGHWIFLESIGEGSQGSIFKGQSVTNDRFTFAVKMIHDVVVSEGGLDALPEDARVEIENMASLSHPNIVQCFGAEILGNHLYIYMELMTGGSLAKFIIRRGRLSEYEASRFTCQVLEAVYYLHSKRARPVMHRDIKASNILLSGDYSQIKLCDFGSSTRQIQENLKRLTRISPTAVAVFDSAEPKSCSVSFSHDTNDLNEYMSSSIKGTCNWIAPEVLKGQPYSVMCDVWSLGCLVIEMITGRIPWKNFDNPVAAMYNIMTSDSTPIDFIPDDVRPEISDACIDFLRCCLDRKVASRWTAKRLLKHPWVRSRMPTIPGTPASVSSPGTPLTNRAII